MEAKINVDGVVIMVCLHVVEMASAPGQKVVTDVVFRWTWALTKP